MILIPQILFWRKKNQIQNQKQTKQPKSQIKITLNSLPMPQRKYANISMSFY